MNKNTILVLIGGILLVGLSYVLIFKNIEEREASYVNQAPVTSGENAQSGSAVHDLPVEPAAAMARKDLALKLAVSEKSIVILLIEDKTWTDGCLGLGGIAESCLAVMVPGFRIEMQSGTKQYVYRANIDGSVVREEQVVVTESIINGAK